MTVFRVGDTVELVSSDTTKLLGNGFSSATKGVIISTTEDVVGKTYEIETEDTVYSKVPASSLKLVHSEENFKSQQEIWEYLIAGGMVQKINSGSIYGLINGTICKKYPDNIFRKYVVTFIHPELFRTYQEPAVTNWYDNIPPQGVLCWVSDGIGQPTRFIHAGMDTITAYRRGTRAQFISTVRWCYATPVTQEEVNELIYNPPNQ